MHPPDPLPTPRPRRRSRTIILLLIPMVAIATYLLWDRLASDSPSPAAPPNPSMPYAGNPTPSDHPPTPANQDALLQGLVPGQSPSQWLVRQPDDQAMDHRNPADLPDYPGGKRTGGFRRQAAHQIEEVVFWQLPQTSARQALDYFSQAATKVGFKALGLTTTTQPAPTTQDARVPLTLGQLLAVTDPHSPRMGWVLVIRATQQPAGDTRVLLWLRYPIGVQP